MAIKLSGEGFVVRPAQQPPQWLLMLGCQPTGWLLACFAINQHSLHVGMCPEGAQAQREAQLERVL